MFALHPRGRVIAVGQLVLTGVLVVSLAPAAMSAPIPVPTYGTGTEAPAETAVVLERDRPCFLVRARWNDSLDGGQPLCSAA